MKQPIHTIDGVRINPEAMAVENVSRLIESYYPGRLDDDEELKEATEQMMRRFGWEDASDRVGYTE